MAHYAIMADDGVTVANIIEYNPDTDYEYDPASIPDHVGIGWVKADDGTWTMPDRMLPQPAPDES